MVALLWIVAVLFLVLTVVNPRELWYATTAWQFRHPEANEPSEASFALGRVVSGVAALGFGIAAVVSTVGEVAPLSQDRLDSSGSAAARDLAGDYFQFSAPDELDVEEALGRDDVEVREDRSEEDDAPFGESYGIRDYFEITGTEDDSIVGCLETSYDGGLFHEGDLEVTATYTPGPC